MIEAHREALLHSFIVGRSDRDRDGFLSLDERKEMLAELGYEVGDETSIESLVVPFPRRRTRSRLPHLLRRAGIEGPGATTVAFSSMDGFGMGTVAGKTSKQRLRPVLHVDEAGSPIDEHEAEKARLDRGACSMPLARCFGADFLGSKKRFTAVDVFRKLVSGEPTCGDCAIVALVGKSGLNSLSAFLPDCELSSSSSAIDMPPTSLFSLSKSSVSVNFLPSPSPSCSSARAFAIRRILRYSHTLGDSTSRFIGMQNDRTMKMTFEKMRERKERGEIPPTFLTLSTSFFLPSSSLLRSLFSRTSPLFFGFYFSCSTLHVYVFSTFADTTPIAQTTTSGTSSPRETRHLTFVVSSRRNGCILLHTRRRRRSRNST